MTSAASNLSQRFPQKRAFITGAASGLGLACAEILAREGWQLFLTDVDGPRLDLIAAGFARDGARVAAAPCDVRDADAVRAIVDAAVAAAGGLDLAIHCAGCQYRPDRASGDTACPFTTLYWDFLLRHEKTLAANQRMSLQLRNLARLSPAEREAITARATAIRESGVVT